MIIKNAQLYIDGSFIREDLGIQNGRIVDRLSEAEGEEILDAEGLLAIPGLVDIHFHGAMGRDFCNADEESIQIIADYEASQGILAICPATMTYSEEILTPIMEAAAKHKNEKGADLVGINLEGPYISPGKVGAQNPLYVMGADGNMFERLQDKSNHMIRLVDLAPEEPGNMDFIKTYSDCVRISIAHTCTSYAIAREAFLNGAKHLTHLFNAMPGITHREPGPIIAGLEEGATAEIIADGIHIHPAMVRFAFQTFGADRMILISDSLEATGLPDGHYMLGGQPITVIGKKAVLTEKPDTIAGSASSLFTCLRTAVLDMQVPLEEAIRAATMNPAEAIGVSEDYGSLTPGHYGNVILMTRDFEIIHIIRHGELIR